MAKIKVVVMATLEVDTEVWDLEYGNGCSAAAVRADVKGYVKDALQQINEHLTVVAFQ